MNSESRADKLWIPQNTKASEVQEKYKAYWPSFMRQNFVLVEARSGSVLEKSVLQGALDLHLQIENVTGDGEGKGLVDTFRTLCVPQDSNGHPCLTDSILGLWSFSATTLAADLNPLATINAAGKSQDDLKRVLGKPVFAADGSLVSAQSLTMHYWLKSRRVMEGSSMRDPRGQAWEKSYLELLQCDVPSCTDNDCVCSYPSSLFNTYVWAERSRSDEFGNLIRGDVGMINAAFLVMIIYVTLNLGGLCHKIKSRALLAMGCILCIVLSGAAGYGLAMYLQFDYTPVMSVLPFVLLGIGVDDSFVIMNAIDRVDPALPVAERIATAMSHAGVSIMFTSLTDFTAFAISVSSALPALSAFCMYAALSIFMLFILQVLVFAAFATFDLRRVDAGKIDCCPCLCKAAPGGCPCCPTVAVAEAMENGKDKNQMLCAASPHKGGRIGSVLEKYFGPCVTNVPVAVAIVFVSFAFFGLCVWMSTQLDVEDVAEKFIPDNSYLQMTIKKQGESFGEFPISVKIVTLGGNYFAAQAALTNIGARLDKLGTFTPSASSDFHSWADSFRAAVRQGVAAVGASVAHTDGIASDKTQYYAGLNAWLGGKGAQFSKDVIWVNDADPQQGIKAGRTTAVLKTLVKASTEDGLDTDEVKAVEVMDIVMEAVAGWTDMPGGANTAFAYDRSFLEFEVFRIIRKEMFMSVGLCLGAVLVLTTIIIAHPGTALLIFTTVVMVIVDLLGCMYMWGLAIDNVTVIQLVIAVGLAVDYSAHVGHNFMTKDGTNEERVIQTLGDVGSAVLNGGVSTFLAVMVLAGSKSYVFRVLFQTFFLTVVLGLIHGLIVLPALLSLVGPRGYAGSGSARSQAVVSPGPVGKGEDSQ